MTTRLNILILCLLLPGFLAANGLELPDRETTTIRKGIDYLYNLEYQAALTNFGSLLPTLKNHPAPWFFTAMVWWIRCAQYDDFERSGRQFERAIETAIDRARALLSAEPGSPAGVFYLSGSLGFSGRYHLMKGDIARAVTVGWEAYRLLQANTNAFRENRDILLGLGLFNFYAGKLPAAVRGLAAMLGIRGDMQLGLKQLAEVAREGCFARTEADLALSHIYTYDLRNGAAGLGRSKGLLERYPRNPEFRLQYAENLLAVGDHAAAVQAVEEGLEMTRKTIYRPTHLFRFYCLLGKIHYSRNDYRQAIVWLDRAIRHPEKTTGNYLAWAHLRRGDAFAANRYEDLARKDFRRALELDGAGSAGDAARSRLGR